MIARRSCLLILTLMVPLGLAAQDPVDSRTIGKPSLFSSLSSLDKLGSALKPLQTPAKGVELHVNYSIEVFGDVSGGYRRGAAADGLLTLSAQLDLGELLKLSDLKGSTISASAYWSHGPSISGRYVHDLNGISSIDAYDTIRFNELWFEKKFGETFSLRLGLLAADTEFFNCTSDAIFLNSCFGMPPIVSLNLNAPIFPLSAPGIRLALSPNDSLTCRLGLFGGDTGMEDINNKRGLRFSNYPDAGAFVIGESVCSVPGHHPTSYTIGGFYHSDHDANTIADGLSHGNHFGWYASVERTLSEKPAKTKVSNSGPGNDHDVTAFFRAGGAAPSSRNPITLYFDGGLNFAGGLWRKPKDSAGIACSYTNTSDELSAQPTPTYELVTEAVYNAVLSKSFTLQPDIQFIVHPGANPATPNALVIGMRLTMTY